MFCSQGIDLDPQFVTYSGRGLNLRASFYTSDRSLLKDTLSQIMPILMPLGTNICSDFTAASLMLGGSALMGEG